MSSVPFIYFCYFLKVTHKIFLLRALHLHEKNKKESSPEIMFLYKNNLQKAHLLIDPYITRESEISDFIYDRMKQVKVI
jgi:hypothetical protein